MQPHCHSSAIMADADARTTYFHARVAGRKRKQRESEVDLEEQSEDVKRKWRQYEYA